MTAVVATATVALTQGDVNTATAPKHRPDHQTSSPSALAADGPARQTDRRVSRSLDRPKLPGGQASAAAQQTTKAVEARQARLAATTTSARNMSHQIAKQRRKAAREAHEWDLPTSGFRITAWFGEAGPYWASGHHTGVDFATACGTPVVAIGDGTISDAGAGIGGWAYGNQIRLRFSNGSEVWYNHLTSIGVSKGETVQKGQELGTVGETGNAYGCHLHFEYRKASDLDTAVDPVPYFAEHGIHLH